MNEIIKYIESLCIEMEQSFIHPNTLCMSESRYEELRKEFPYLIENKIYKRAKGNLQVVLTLDDIISVGYAYLYENTKEIST
jgi:hypothetical protein